MQNKFKNITDLEFVATLKMLATAYEEISVIRMQRAKSSVLATREFLTELANVFADVKANYQAELTQMKNKQPGTTKPRLVHQQFNTGTKNGKMVSVFLASEDKLYGDIVSKIFHLFQFQLFLLENKKSQSDIIVVGKAGKELYEMQKTKSAYTFFDFPDNNIPATELTKLAAVLNQYEKVNVFYGKFENVMTQAATVASVSGDQPQSIQQSTDKMKFFFEPSLGEIMQFFEEQVFFSLFNQAIHENELARLASRIKAMEEALGNIQKSELQLRRESIRIKKRLGNKKQIETLAGISLWRNQ